MTFVILTGGIDLSVGSVVAMTAMLSAFLLEKGLPAALVLLVALLIGPTLGFLMGCVVHFFDIQPFIVTLAGMFFARGMCTFISGSFDLRSPTGSGPGMSQERVGNPPRQLRVDQRAHRPRGGGSSPRTRSPTPGWAATCTRSAATPSRRC